MGTGLIDALQFFENTYNCCLVVKCTLLEPSARLVGVPQERKCVFFITYRKDLVLLETNKMDTIQFQNQEFKIKEIELAEFGAVLLSTNSLNELLLKEDGSYTSDEAKIVDEEIFYFVEDNEIELSEDELIKVVNLELR